MALVRDALRSTLHLISEQTEDINEKRSRVQNHFVIHPGKKSPTPTPRSTRPPGWCNPRTVLSCQKTTRTASTERAQSYPGRSPNLRSTSQMTAARGGKETRTENEHLEFRQQPPIQLHAQQLTLTGLVAIHENDTQNYHEETQLRCVLGPKRNTRQRESLWS